MLHQARHSQRPLIGHQADCDTGQFCCIDDGHQAVVVAGDAQGVDPTASHQGLKVSGDLTHQGNPVGISAGEHPQRLVIMDRLVILHGVPISAQQSPAQTVAVEQMTQQFIPAIAGQRSLGLTITLVLPSQPTQIAGVDQGNGQTLGGGRAMKGLFRIVHV